MPPVGATTLGIQLGEKGKGKRERDSVDEGQMGRSSKQQQPQSSFDLPWVEKYRPKLIKDVMGNSEAVKRLKVIAEHGNIPNLLLAGSPGTGKTTSILCIANQLLGKKLTKEAVLELNASDERGIDVVRNRIKMFAQKKVTLPPGRHKIVILDEADSMTKSAQQALRRTMEIFSNTTRFALACNMSTKIIEPIQSRCAVVRFSRLTNEDILERLLDVCNAENVPKTDEGLEAITFTADGDMRQALNNLQATYSGFGLVNADNVFKVCDQPHPTVVKKIVQSCIDARIDKAVEILQEMWASGYSANDLITTLFRVCRYYEMPEFLKLEFIKEIGFGQMRILEGVNSQLQFAGLLAKLCKLSKKMKG
jgi:replication factor C subunit 2/4